MAVTDPHNMPELLCEGPFNTIVTHTGVAVITFTHSRTPVDVLFTGKSEPDHIVRARIAMSMSSLKSLRDALNGLDFGPGDNNVKAPAPLSMVKV